MTEQQTPLELRLVLLIKRIGAKIGSRHFPAKRLFPSFVFAKLEQLDDKLDFPHPAPGFTRRLKDGSLV